MASRTTFKLVVEEYLDACQERELAPAATSRKRWYLLDLAKPIHNRPINEINPAEVLYLLKSIEKSGRRETAKKMRGGHWFAGFMQNSGARDDILRRSWSRPAAR